MIERVPDLITFNIPAAKSLKIWAPDKGAVMGLARRWAEWRPATAHEVQKHLEGAAARPPGARPEPGPRE